MFKYYLCNMNDITHDELFDRCYELATSTTGGAARNRLMHETLVLACAKGTPDGMSGFGNLFAQGDHLCKSYGISRAERRDIQTMRRHSNTTAPLSHDDLMYDIRALCLFISAVCAADIPSRLTSIIPRTGRPYDADVWRIDVRRIRCIVWDCDEHHILVTTDTDNTMRPMLVDYTAGVPDGSDGDKSAEADKSHNGNGPDCRRPDYNKSGYDMSYLRTLVREGMQLNLLDCRVEGDNIRPQLIVVEPDFLIDISSLAACFTDYGHNPLAYTINRMRPRPNTQPILLGNAAGRMLDSIINDDETFSLNNTISGAFREEALQYCTCTDFNPAQFKTDAATQADNIREAIDMLFRNDGTGQRGSEQQHDISKAVLEPSFVCESLGLQGRADLMTTDHRLLVEQKSGKPAYGTTVNPNGQQVVRYTEAHNVQLLLYYGVLQHNFGINREHADIKLLYSRFPARQGLITANFFRALFNEAIRLRNRIVAGEFYIARHGFGTIMPRLNTAVINERNMTGGFFETYIRPQIEAVTRPLHAMPPLERAYFERMMTFVYREQLASRVGTHERTVGSGAASDLWNMPLHEKIDTGNILFAIRADRTDSASDTAKNNGTDDATLIYLDITAPPEQIIIYNKEEKPDATTPAQQPETAAGAASTFRRGDMVYLYPYHKQPDVCHNLLYKGTIDEMGDGRITIRLNNAQRNMHLFEGARFAIEHASSDVGTVSAMRSLHTLITAPEQRRALLLGQRPPQTDSTLRLSRSYHPHYDEVLLKVRQARDYFLLIGPPGTGKTSMALRFMVEEELTDSEASILLMSYTNRAVDEICAMLTSAEIPFIHIGSRTSCDPQYRHSLLETALGDSPRLDTIRQKIQHTRVIVATTSTMQARPFIFELKHFSLAIVDEASQILEPSVIGLLAAHNSTDECCIDRFVLVGDHKQLSAVVQQSENDSRVTDPMLTDICLTNCRRSLFERLIDTERRAGRTDTTGVLRRHGRMHPDVARFATTMFYADEHLVPVPCQHQTETALDYTLPAEDSLDELLKSRRMLFIPSEYCRSMSLSDKVNICEARIVADVVRRIQRFYGDKFDAGHTVGVIVPYRNQIAMIRSEMHRMAIAHADDITIDTVERYQGSQRDVIIYSFTIQQRSQLTFLTSNCFTENGHTIDRKLNVALTRARRQTVMTGYKPVLNTNPLFAELIKAAEADPTSTL